MARGSESAEERSARLAKDRQCHRTARASESDEQRSSRLAQDRQCHRTARASESDEQRSSRLAQDQQCHRTARASESDEKRSSRLAKDQQSHHNARSLETEEQELLRRSSNRVRASSRRNKAPKLSIFLTSRAGLKYDPTVNYENDAAVQIGGLSITCLFCKAKKFEGEPPGMCCTGGKVSLPLLTPPPQPLKNLITGETKQSNDFLKRIRMYNSAFQMTSFGASREIVEKGFMPTFKVQGQVYHLIGSLEPSPEEDAKFLQIYFMGNRKEQCEKRCSNFEQLNRDTIYELQDMLHSHNELVQSFKTMRDKMSLTTNYKIVIRADKKPVKEHARRFNAPDADEVAILLVGDLHEKRDIVIEARGGKLQRASETHKSYDALQYPLIFLEGARWLPLQYSTP